MFRFIKKFLHSVAVFLIAGVFSFCLFVFFLNPLRPIFFLGSELRAASMLTNSASVPLNPINKLVAQLNEKEQELSARESLLDQRALVMEKENSIWKNRLLLGILFFLIVLFILMLINFYLDGRRQKELEKLEKLENKT